MPGAGATCRAVPERLSVLFLSSAFPRTPDAGVDGILARRARELGRHASVLAVVPTPWVPPLLGVLRPRWRLYGRTARQANFGGLDVVFPRYLQLPGRWFVPLAPLSMAIGVLPLVRRLRHGGACNVIFAQFTLPDGLAAALLGRWTGIPATCLGRGTDVNVVGSGTRLGRWLTAWTVRHCAAVAVVAHDLAATLARLADTPALPAVLYHGIDLERFAPGDKAGARRALGIEGADPMILFVGRLLDGKGLAELVEALGRLQAHMVARLVIVGDGPLRTELARSAAQAGIAERVHMVGERPYDEVPLWIRAADVVVLPSEREGFPNVVREALACGRPVVATPVGDIPRVVDNSAGRLVPIGDPRALAAALLEVLRSDWDPQAIRARVAHMTWERNAAETYAFLRDAVARC